VNWEQLHEPMYSEVLERGPGRKGPTLHQLIWPGS